MKEIETVETITVSPAQTERIAEEIGRGLKGGEVIELASDLGGGKTTFVRGLARGMGSTDHVSSPTFKISNVYKAGELELHHFDFYRLPEAGIIADELAEVIGDPTVVTVLEWSQSVQDVLPEKRLTITLAPRAEAETERRLNFRLPKELAYLIKNVIMTKHK